LEFVFARGVFNLAFLIFITHEVFEENMSWWILNPISDKFNRIRVRNLINFWISPAGACNDKSIEFTYAFI
tara:strand:- start:433 stop:645 length:213 start_codon:yes stop_codon:yes gene_type:complete